MDSCFRNIYLVGCNGYIGKRLYASLKDSYTVRKVDIEAEYALDLNRPELFDYQVFNNDLVIITAAISSPDACENDRDKAYRINVVGTSFLIAEALERNCKVLFFSSDAVYGFYDGIVNENTVTVGETAYGSMKKQVEDQFKDNPNFKAIRLSYVFSKDDKYTSYLLSCAENDTVADVYHPFYRNVTTLDDVINTVRWLIVNWNEFESTFLNVCGKEMVSRLRIADEIKRCTKINLRYHVGYPGDAFYKNRPSILEMQSLYIDTIIDSQESFSQKVKKQFITGGKS